MSSLNALFILSKMSINFCTCKKAFAQSMWLKKAWNWNLNQKMALSISVDKKKISIIGVFLCLWLIYSRISSQFAFCRNEIDEKRSFGTSINSWSPKLNYMIRKSNNWCEKLKKYLFSFTVKITAWNIFKIEIPFWLT